jgi:hypothetical protein
MAGRPTAYKIEFVEQVYKLCLLGATDIEIADFFGVCEDTINNWKKNHKEFFVSLKKGKVLADADVASSLYNRAKGYEHSEEKIFNDNGSALRVETTKHYPPDTGACALWLKNRQPKKWRDKVEIENNHSGEVKSTIDPTKLKEAIKTVLDDVDC